MIIGTGIDIIDVKRFKIQYEKENIHFFEKIFTEKELSHLNKKKGYINLAGKFSAKEAFFKALGTGKINPFRWKDVEVLSGHRGKPALKIMGETAKYLKKFGNVKIHLSISHIDEIATAIVIIETQS